MTTETTRKIRLTSKEMLVADAALSEYEKTGKTDILCPRCQSALIVRVGESSESVSCVTGDFRMTVRGI